VSLGAFERMLWILSPIQKSGTINRVHLEFNFYDYYYFVSWHQRDWTSNVRHAPTIHSAGDRSEGPDKCRVERFAET